MPLSGEAPDHYSLETLHTVKLLKPAAAYRFKYRAINIFGTGSFSAETVVIAATTPE